MSLLKKLFLLAVVGVAGVSAFMLYRARKNPEAIVKAALPVLELKETTTNVIPGQPIS